MKWVGYGFDEVDGGYRKQCWAPRRTFDGSNVGGSIPLEAIIIGDQGWYSQDDLRSRPSALPLTTYLIKTGKNKYNLLIICCLSIFVSKIDFRKEARTFLEQIFFV